VTEATTTRPWQAAARSHAGRVRTNNEDLPLIDAERGLFGVIDGVGGHAAGEIAAALARDVILQRLARPLGTPGERVREAIALANGTAYGLSSSVCTNRLDHITRFVITEACFAGHMKDESGVDAVKFVPRGPVVPVIEPLDERLPRGRRAALLQLLEDLLFVGDFRVFFSHEACRVAPEWGEW
jgi:hypothetical protein